MLRLCQQKGFTLVELAIVLTIIGLLVGGILKGQQLIENARVLTTLSQIRAVEAAVMTFRETYGSLPGDMTTAPQHVPNCGRCGLIPGPTSGDGIVGPPLWDMQTNVSLHFAGGAAAGNVNNETVLFWAEMAHAGWLTGITDEGITDTATIFGGSLPAARMGGGWIVGNANANGAIPGRPVILDTNMTGTVIALIMAPTLDLDSTPGRQALTSRGAAQIDRRLDDGSPGTGDVQSYGVTASCYTSAVALVYNETVNSKDCGLYFKISG